MHQHAQNCLLGFQRKLLEVRCRLLLVLTEGTADDWFHADYVINWLGNPAYTHQTDIHFQYEARYKGTKLVSIAPDFSPSTVHSDLWLNVRISL